MTLSGGVLRELVVALADVYAPLVAEEYPARVLAVVSRLVAAESYSYNTFTAGGATAVWLRPAEAGPSPDGLEAFQKHVPQHPVLTHNRATGDGSAKRVSDFLSDRQFHALPLYQDFYRPLSVDHQLSIAVGPPDGSLIGVALNRHKVEFSDDERDVLDLLLPHIAQGTVIADLLRQPLPWTPRGRDGEALLTPRQTRVLQLVARGLTDRAVARILGIGTRTVHTHLQHVYRALDVTSRTEALARLRTLTLPDDPAGGTMTT